MKTWLTFGECLNRLCRSFRTTVECTTTTLLEHCAQSVDCARCFSYLYFLGSRYNIGHVAIGIGDLGLAYQTYKMAVSVDHNHAESFNNLGVLELRNGSIFAAKSNFSVSQNLAPYMFEAFFNAALVTYKLGDYQESHKLIRKSLAAYPNHFYSNEVLRHLDSLFSAI